MSENPDASIAKHALIHLFVINRVAENCGGAQMLQPFVGIRAIIDIIFLTSILFVNEHRRNKACSLNVGWSRCGVVEFVQGYVIEVSGRVKDFKLCQDADRLFSFIRIQLVTVFA